jgi:zinc-binding alcohol dehydrogenase/oxidoreductase
VNLDLRAFFYGQYQLFGSTMGSREELRDMMALVEEAQIRPVVGEVFPLDRVEEAFTMLKENKQFGKIAIELP